jgi:hypothetical protein
MDNLSRKQQYMLRKSALWKERSSWVPRWREISDFLLPYSGRFVASDHNRGNRSFNNIYDETATFAHGVLTAGMMAGMTSPARPWFRLATPDRDLMEYEPVKFWLHDVTELMRDIFAKSNTYNALHSLYDELGSFATSASIVDPDYENVIHHNVLTAGEYAIATNEKGQVDTLCREYEMTTMQMVQKFVYRGNRANPPDWSVVSPQIKSDWQMGKNLDTWRPVIHLIQPREERDMKKHDSKNMRFASCYFEPGNDQGMDKFLRESGYKNFPALVPRWHVRGGDIYGNGPSFLALGSIKQLQQEQLRKGQAIDYQVKPPLQVPAEMRNKMGAMMPGGVYYVPTGGQTQGIKSAFDVSLNLQHLLGDIVDVRGRLNKCYYADLFLMISQDNRRTPATATEIAERHEEKLLMLGPVLERLHNELLSPKIDIAFSRIIEAGILPPPPPELQGIDLKVEFVSTLAQAQKMIGLGSLDRFLGTVAQVSAQSQDPSVWDKVNKDEVVDRYSDMLGVDPSIIVADDKVVFIRNERAQAQAAASQAAMMPAAAGAAKDLAGADMSGNNALTNIMQQVQGYNATV